MFRVLRYDWPLHFSLLITNWLPDNVVFFRLRGFLASFFLKKCGKNLRLGRNITFFNPSKITLGDHVYIAYGNWICAIGTIEIGDEVLLGPYNVIVSGNHQLAGESFRFAKGTEMPIVIGAGTWVTSHCVIGGNSMIGKKCLISANSLIRGELEGGKMYGGNPAIEIKEL